jgi:hypothetical protein
LSWRASAQTRRSCSFTTYPRGPVHTRTFSCWRLWRACSDCSTLVDRLDGEHDINGYSAVHTRSSAWGAHNYAIPLSQGRPALFPFPARSQTLLRARGVRGQQNRAPQRRGDARAVARRALSGAFGARRVALGGYRWFVTGAATAPASAAPRRSFAPRLREDLVNNN